MAISLIVYVGWTVWSMVLARAGMQRLLNEIAKGPDGYLERVQAAEAVNVTEVIGYLRLWKAVLWSSGLPALIGGILLAVGAFASVVRG